MEIKVIILIVFVAMLFVPFEAFAASNIERGDTWQKEDLGNEQIKWSGGLPLRLAPDYNKPYYLTETNSYIKIESGTGSFIYDKISCTLNFYMGGYIGQNNQAIIKQDDFKVYGAALNTANWQELTSINNAQCTTSIIQNGNDIEIWATKEVSKQGKIVFKYIKKMDDAVKVQFEATNLNPSWNNHKVGGRQYISVPDNIQVGDTKYYLPDFAGTHITRQWLVDHKESLMSVAGYPLIYIQNAVYDFSLGWQYVDSVDILYENGQSILVINYFNHNAKIAPNQTLVIDPTYTGTPSFDTYLIDTDNDNVCDQTTASITLSNNPSYTVLAVGTEGLANPTDCYRTALKWDTTSIPDGATITDTDIQITQLASSNNNPDPICTFYAMPLDPSTLSDNDLWLEIKNGTNYGALSDCNNPGADTARLLDLGVDADIDLQNKLYDNFFALGFADADETMTVGNAYSVFASADHTASSKRPVLTVVYVAPSPSYLNTTPLTTNAILLKWDYSGNATGYKIETQTAKAGAWSTLINNTGTTDKYYYHSGLGADTFHNYRVTAWDNGASGLSNESNNNTWDDPNGIACMTPGSIWVQ